MEITASVEVIPHHERIVDMQAVQESRIKFGLELRDDILNLVTPLHESNMDLKQHLNDAQKCISWQMRENVVLTSLLHVSTDELSSVNDDLAKLYTSNRDLSRQLEVSQRCIDWIARDRANMARLLDVSDEKLITATDNLNAINELLDQVNKSHLETVTKNETFETRIKILEKENEDMARALNKAQEDAMRAQGALKVREEPPTLWLNYLAMQLAVNGAQLQHDTSADHADGVADRDGREDEQSPALLSSSFKQSIPFMLYAIALFAYVSRFRKLH